MVQSHNFELEDKLYRENLGIVISQALKYPPTTICDIDDYIQIGSLALLESIRKFNIKKNTKWSTFATTCVGRAIYKEYLKTKFALRMPVKSGKLAYKISPEEIQKYSDIELAEKFNIRLNTLQGIKSLLSVERLKLEIVELIDNDNVANGLDELIDQILTDEEKALLLDWITGLSFKKIAAKRKKPLKIVTESIKSSIEKLKQEYVKKENSLGS